VPRADALLQPPEDGALMASYSVFVVEPGAQVGTDIIYVVVAVVVINLYIEILLKFKM